MSFPTAVHMGERPDIGAMHRITNYPVADVGHDKPLGGLWCSTLDPQFGTDWLRACEDMGGAWSWHGNQHAKFSRGSKEHHAWSVVPHYNVRILHLEDEEDYEILVGLYPRATGTKRGYLDDDGNHVWEDAYVVDWEAVAKDYDVLYVHKEAQSWMRDWDCETILFMHPKFECIGMHPFAESIRERRCDV